MPFCDKPGSSAVGWKVQLMRSGLEQCRVVFLVADGREKLIFQANRLLQFDVERQLRGNEVGHIGIELCIDGRHHAFAKQNSHDVGNGNARTFGKHPNRARQLDCDFVFTGGGGVGARTPGTPGSTGSVVVLVPAPA